MKNSFFVAIAFIAATSITSQLFAQNSAAKTAGYDLKKNVKARVVQTDTGCSIVFESSPPSSNGSELTKKGYDYYKASSAFSVSAADNSVTEVTSPRDPASGLATGKRMHKPMVVSSETTSSASSTDATMAKGSGLGAGKVNVQDFSFTKRCGGKSTKISCDSGDCEIPIEDCPNGDCSLIASWSWGATQSGSSNVGSGGSKRCSVDFLLKIEEGVCTAMAINEKGLPGGKSTTKK